MMAKVVFDSSRPLVVGEKLRAASSTMRRGEKDE
jgi:hypothetical protein